MARRAKRVKIAPQLKEGEQPGVTRHWRGLFLDYLAESSNVTKSAERAGVNPSRAYKLRREDPEFARAWLFALWEGYSHLEMEVLRRLRDGDQKAGIVDALDGSKKEGNEKAGAETAGTQKAGAADKYDFASAIRLLNAHRENAVRAEAQQRNVSAAEVRASIDRKVEAIRLQVQREKREAIEHPCSDS
ncbi:MAG: hypothetical protein WA936_05860 [Erythrobacter sp.]|uniref:hypothetical protein n=1 Tax=Erythrobacter sp. TaxID=1042 RepID=UPI003C7392CB